MLGTAQADALSAQSGPACVARGVGVGAGPSAGDCVSPAHEAAEVRRPMEASTVGIGRRRCCRWSRRWRSSRPRRRSLPKVNSLAIFVHVDVAAAGDAAGAHAAGNNGRVGGHAAADGQDALAKPACPRCPRGWSPDGPERPSRPAGLPISLASSAVKTIWPQAAPGEAASPCRRPGAAFRASSVELGMQQGIQLLGLDAQDSLLLGDHALVHQVAGDLAEQPGRYACRYGSAACTACRPQW